MCCKEVARRRALTVSAHIKQQEARARAYDGAASPPVLAALYDIFRLVCISMNLVHHKEYLLVCLE